MESHSGDLGTCLFVGKKKGNKLTDLKGSTFFGIFDAVLSYWIIRLKCRTLDEFHCEREETIVEFIGIILPCFISSRGPGAVAAPISLGCFIAISWRRRCC